MLNYKLYDETENIVIGDQRIWDNQIYQALTNIPGIERKNMSNIPVFNANWVKLVINPDVSIEVNGKIFTIVINSNNDSVTFTLPHKDLFDNIVLKCNNYVNPIIIQTFGTETIDGNNTISINDQYNAVIIYSGEVNLFLLNEFKSVSDSTSQPYLSGNTNITLLTNQTDNLTITGDNFDQFLDGYFGDEVSVNSITAISPTEITVNYTTTAISQLPTSVIISRQGRNHFGDSITCTTSSTVIGTGSAGIWTTNFNTASNGQAAWDSNVPNLNGAWVLTIGSMINSIDGFFITSNTTTPSSNTGPTSPYDSYYMFGERSTPNSGPNSDCVVETTNFRDLTDLSFHYHKFSAANANMGDLVVYSQNANNSWTERWRHTGDEQAAQADPFVQQVFDTTTWDCKGIRISWENGLGWQGDIAIDNIVFTSI